MTILPAFKGSEALTMGVELEMQLVNLHTYNLTMEAEDFLRRVSMLQPRGEIKLEITQSMIEINSSIHKAHDMLLAELAEIRNTLTLAAAKTHIGICGGGTHPFQRWQAQRISHSDRFASVSEQYGYLAKQFTVFGQHIHIACPNGDDALYLCHALIRYLPHFIALSASSPFNQGVDTSFDCSRLAVISAFPLSGTPPWLLTWSEFNAYFEKLYQLGIVKSMKDFYWDIRPKPEYGTIELRICDTPLTVTTAAALAAYAQLLVCMLLEKRPALGREMYLTYLMNRFRAARYGLDAIISDAIHAEHRSLAEDIMYTCEQLEPYAARFASHAALKHIELVVATKNNGALWLRNQFAKLGSMNDVVREQAKLWRR